MASELIDQEQPGEFNQAIMEFGALQCKPQNPDCKSCIFCKECKAYEKKMVSEIPVKINKLKIKKRYFHYFMLTFDDKVYLNKRIAKDIWHNLYDFPLIESSRFFPKNKLIIEFTNQFNIEHDKISIVKTSADYKHILTHQQIFARFYEITLDDQKLFNDFQLLSGNQFVCIQKKMINQYPLPRLIDKYLTENYTI